MITKAAYLTGDTPSTELEALSDAAAAHAAADCLRSLADQDDAVARGVSGLLFCWRAVHRSRLQLLQDGSAYLETCPAYLATVEGVSVWSARVGWSAARAVLGWMEEARSTVRALGATLRRLARGRRAGRQVLLKPWQVLALDLASGGSPHQAACYTVETPAHFWGLSSRSRSRTLSISCPAHNDCRPSLVLWSNGGGHCMACQWSCAWAQTGQTLELYGKHSRSGQHFKALAHNQGSVCRLAVDCRSAAPVGGMVATHIQSDQHAGAKLEEYRSAQGELQTALSRGSSLSGCVVDILRRADGKSQGPATTARAECAGRLFSHGRADREVMPDLLLSVSCMSRAHWSEGWRSRVQRWMLLDLDGIQGLDGLDSDQLGQALLSTALADTEAGSRAAVVRTSPTGLQVWLQLQQPRHSPAAWMAKPEVQAWHSRLGCLLLQCAQDLGASGGRNDPSACAAGRWGRRPGWRMKRGQLYCSRLIASQ